MFHNHHEGQQSHLCLSMISIMLHTKHIIDFLNGLILRKKKNYLVSFSEINTKHSF